MSELIIESCPKLTTIESRVSDFLFNPLLKFEHLKLTNLTSLVKLDFLNSALSSDQDSYSPYGPFFFIELSNLPNLKSLGLKTPLLVRPAANLKIIADGLESFRSGADLCYLENALK